VVDLHEPATLEAVSAYVMHERPRDGITVNTLAPGQVETGRIRQYAEDVARREGRSPQDVEHNMVASIPIGRFGRPEEFAAAAAFLGSERAGFITGVTLLVDGGLFRGTY
jgi:3-oxoacyl-[acyl-carrier protein] reductase